MKQINFFKNLQSPFLTLITLSSLLFLTTGCSSVSVTQTSPLELSQKFNQQLMSGKIAKQDIAPAPILSSGSLVIAKRMPLETSISELPLYGFIPFQLSTDGVASSKPMWIEIDLDDSEVILKKGKKEIFSTNIKEQASLPVKGIYSVKYRAESPLWHATESYFTNRGLNIPAEGDASRLLKGALGSHAIFLESGLVLHSGEYELEEDYQLRLAPRALADIYQQIDTGTRIVIK